MFPVVPGAELQREMAYRFGVNWVMYALTGNYKTDQVHVPAIIERLVAAGCAYVAEDHVLFHVAAMQDYGRLSNRSLDEMIAGVAKAQRDWAISFSWWGKTRSMPPPWMSNWCG